MVEVVWREGEEGTRHAFQGLSYWRVFNVQTSQESAGIDLSAVSIRAEPSPPYLNHH